MNNCYRTITEVFDFGPHISKVILDMGQSMTGATLSEDMFTVSVKRTAVQGEDFEWPLFMGKKLDIPMEGLRKVTGLYPSDEEGSPREDGHFLTLEMYCDPRDGLGAIIRFNGTFNVFVNVAYTITQEKPILLGDNKIEGMVFDRDGGNRILYGEWLKKETFPHPEIPLSYVYYQPETAADEKVPLIIWLHGAGEGGEDTPIAAIGNKVVNLISPELQAYFGGKAWLLAPQCPTMWMDDGSGLYTTSGISRYADPLESLIEAFTNAHPGIDRDRIYLGGCSNGGFMTMRMLLHHPSRYAAAFPVCEAMYDKALTEEDIHTLATIPIWFTHCRVDPVVKPEDYVIPTYKRLLAAGAQDVHLTYWDKVTDSTGNYVEKDGSPYEYNGHWSWIPMLNNECRLDYDGKPVMLNGKAVSIVEWLAAHKK